ncbi:RELT-like protein 2 [Paramormyrops kingsleyae]|uniref:RELT like 2 n=1 Tax=Paramormyrops kingsleyae TaxID=1676925 RepID=A0A3B3Q8L0_9TELE|nr:RELT-like protein 1 [Paramormyrops kingsleyae]XP_023650728.1 RELT-like protein 1 [Paramormyrops kingsleyae]
MTDQVTSSVGEPPPQYMIFLLVFFFFLTGLLGFLICHMLKKKGYRCRTGEPEDEEEGQDKVAANNDDGSEENQDTVEQILKCIIENEANMEAFKEMLGAQNVCEHVDARLMRKDSMGGVPPHHHTVHSGTDRNSCHLCAQGQSKKARRRSRVARFKARSGEQTVFSVGRFRVTHIEKKNSIPGTPIFPIPESSENTEQQNTEKGPPGKRLDVYDLQKMFKGVNPEATNGTLPPKGSPLNPKRSTSDPATVKTSQEGTEHKAETAANQGDDTDVPTDPEMISDKGSPCVVESDSGAADAEDMGIPRLGPVRTREFCVVRTGDPPDEAAQGEDGRDDMVEMEDIKDCRVSQGEESASSTREQKRRSVHTQLKW